GRGRGNFPEPGGVVHARGQDDLPVWAEDCASHPGAVVQWVTNWFAGVLRRQRSDDGLAGHDVPETDAAARSSLAAGDEGMSIGTQRHAGDHIAMLQGLADLLAAGRVPAPDLAVISLTVAHIGDHNHVTVGGDGCRRGTRPSWSE